MKAPAVLLVVAALAGAASASTPSAPGRTVPCAEVILATKWPYLGNRKPEHRYRTVLDAVSVPPAYMQQVAPTTNMPWAYFRKASLVVRAGAGPVTVTVPRAWQGQAAIAWGNAGHGPYSSIRIARCAAGRTGRAYAGGFFLRAPSACVPLIFQVAGRSATVRFGIGRRCP